MDDDEQRRRQAEQTSYRQSFHENTPYGGTVTPGVGNSRGRPSTRPTDGTRHPHSISSPGSVPNITGYGYAAEQQYPPQQPQGQPFAYQSEYSANPQRVQPYSQYPQQMIYNVPQHGQVHDQSPLAFSNAPPYLQRQSTAVEVLATHFGGQSYYNPGETQVSAAPSSYPAPSFQHSMQYPSQTDFSQAPLIPNYPLNPHLAISESEPAQRQQQQAIQDPFTAHRQLLRRTNSLTIQGRLREARNPLLAMSQRLLDQIEILGLNQDILALGPEGRAAYRERLEFWRDFHHCWLAFLQRQLDDTLASRRSTARTLTADLLEELGDEVVRIGNSLEKYGLVDYEMGFFEKELIPLIIKCIDVLAAIEDSSSTPAGVTAPAAP